MNFNNLHRVRPEHLFDEGEKCLEGYFWSNDRGYRYRKPRGVKNGKSILAHCEVMEAILGRKLKEGEEVDHINGIRYDNRRLNLRAVTHQQNTQNIHKKGRGSRFDKRVNRWQGFVSQTIAGKRIFHHCGMFATQQEAMAASAKKRAELGFLDSIIH